MESTNYFGHCYALVAKAADCCLKPWQHAVVDLRSTLEVPENDGESFELIMRIECRSCEGERYPQNDLELEIYKSGNELNLMLSWSNQLDQPILWQGKHSVWLDPIDGKRCAVPVQGLPLESLARRLRSLFSMSDQE